MTRTTRPFVLPQMRSEPSPRLKWLFEHGYSWTQQADNINMRVHLSLTKPGMRPLNLVFELEEWHEWLQVYGGLERGTAQEQHHSHRPMSTLSPDFLRQAEQALMDRPHQQPLSERLTQNAQLLEQLVTAQMPIIPVEPGEAREVLLVRALEAVGATPPQPLGPPPTPPASTAKPREFKYGRKMDLDDEG